MVEYKSRSNRKVTTGKYKDYRKRKLYEFVRDPTLTKLGDKKIKKLRTRGNNEKLILLSNNFMNLYIPKEKKYKKVKIISVIENPANRHYVRRNIITKSSIVKTELGNAKITSRPGQHGILNGVLIE